MNVDYHCHSYVCAVESSISRELDEKFEIILANGTTNPVNTLALLVRVNNGYRATYHEVLGCSLTFE